MIGTMTGIRVDLNEGVEVSMQGKICNALRQMSERARAEGLEQGIEQGISRGEDETILIRRRATDKLVI